MERLELRAWDRKNKVMFDVYQWNRGDEFDSITRMIGFNKIETLFVGEDIDLVQYTGKKDIDGEKLFEGDIVSCLEVWIDKDSKKVLEQNPVNLQVCFQNYEWVLVGRVFVEDSSNMIRLKFSDYLEDMSWGEGIERYNGNYHALTRWIDFKVISNIHQNLELLQEKS